MPMRSKRVPSIEDDSTLLPTESSLSNDAVSRLRVISERVAQYEQQRPLTLEVQRIACEKMHAQLEALMEGVLEDEMMHLILQLLLRVESLLTDLAASPAKSNTMTSCSSLGPPREHKLIDTRSMTKFNGNVLEYPNYRASLKYVLDLPGRSDGEKYQAIRQTLNDASKAFLAEIDPSNPDLQRALELLDNEYLSGRNVEDAIKCKVHRVKPVTAKSPIKDWLDYQTTVKHLLLFVNAGHLTSTAEKDIHKVLVKKLTEKDEEFAVFKGQTLKELAAVVEEFVNRARHYDREYKPSDRTPRREGERRPFGFPKHHSDPRHHYRPRVQTNTVVAAPCLFCRGQHDMKDCPMALKLKYQKLREHNRCFRCLEDRPRGHDCGRECKQCRRNHHETLCPQPHSSVSKPKETTEKGRNPPRTFTATVMNSACSPRYLPSMRLMVSAQPNHQLPARVLLDSGSTESYVSETFAKALGAHFEEGPPRHVLTFGGQAHFPVSRETRLQLQTDHHRAEISLSVMPPNVVAPIDVPTEEVIRLARRHGVKVSTSSSPVEEVDLLIGANDLNDYFAKENIRTVSLSGSLRAYDSRFGWYLQGSISNESNSGKPRTFLIIGSENQCLCQSLDKLLRDPLSSKNEGDLSTEQWMQSYMQQVIFDPTEKRWIVPLPWISDSRPHNNRSTVYHSTKSQLSRYNERGLREKYDAAIGLYEEGDYAERVDDNTPGAYYLPHHHVFKPGSTTEVRIVMNASFARKGERSLNDTLYKGFSEQNNLFSLLIRWRMNPYAMIADLQKAFLQIRVRPEDRPYLRYLWAPAGSDQLVTYQMKSLMFGSTSAPFCLYITLRKMFESAPEPEVKDMVKSFYMDDAFFLGKDAATVRRLIEIVKRVLTECSFPIHKWACPHWMIPEGFPEVEQKQTIKCLGMQWNLADDTIFFTEVDTTAKVITRREVARIFGRRGVPRVVRSDNEKGFRQVDPYLADLINRRLREGLEAEYKFTWKFQPAKSPFWGGFFERLVGVVKKTLANWPLTRRYTQEELTTILCEVEALVNSRPLTAATHDSSPLTPSHFLIGRSHTFIPPLRMDHERPVDAALLNYVSLSAERDALWNRLKREYLVSLRHFHRLDSTREPQVGELVLIVGPWKRETWDWGRIESLMRGPDGVARAATLLMPNGSHWERPVQSLIPLESNLKGGMCGADNGASSESQVTSSVEMPRSPDQESILKRTPPSTDESAPKMVYKRRSNRLAALPRKRYR